MSHRTPHQKNRKVLNENPGDSLSMKFKARYGASSQTAFLVLWTTGWLGALIHSLVTGSVRYKTGRGQYSTASMTQDPETYMGWIVIMAAMVCVGVCWTLVRVPSKPADDEE